ncbi:MAG: hypothetical protein M1820_001782 [Bogoriella megaspora]|nr:MAG: hypothetical protein M1820_001782 [Bogoriella megaspora]
MPVQSISLRQLGKDGPRVSALGLGAGSLGGAYGTAPNEEEQFQVLDRAVELGETFWDTADMYGNNEEVLGRWFKRTGKRNEVFLASKFGIRMENREFKGLDSSAEYCKRACESSLEKLGTDYIDLYYAHRLNPETPIEETMRALVELRAQGKIKYIGLSEVSSTALRRACKIAQVTAVQTEYSPFVTDIEGATGTDLLKTCRELGIAVICYSPLGRGMLTGTLTARESVTGACDFRATHLPWFSEENIDANIKLVSQFKSLAEKKGCTASQLAITWILKQGDDMIPIPGTKKIKYLEENWAALEVQLTDEEEAAVRNFIKNAEVSGDRSTPAGMSLAYTNTREEA